MLGARSHASPSPSVCAGIVIAMLVMVVAPAVLVWLAVAYGTIIVFEVVKLWQASGLPAKEAFVGSPELLAHH